jgi:hypothetical protein
MPSTTVQRGNVIFDTLVGITITPTVIAAFDTSTQTFAVPGILTSDCVYASESITQTKSVVLSNAFVPANGVLGIQFLNVSAVAVTPVAGLYQLSIQRPENLPLPGNLS